MVSDFLNEEYLGKKVEILEGPHKFKRGFVTSIFPCGVLFKEVIYEVSFGDKWKGQFKDEQIKLVK